MRDIKYPELTMKTVAVGQRYQNNFGSWYTINNVINSRAIAISFDSGECKISSLIDMKTGQIKHAYDRTVFGQGYIGEGVFKPCINGKCTKLYRAWLNMLKRCYCEVSLNDFPTYVDCSVCERWKCYQNFAADAHDLKGFNEWCENNDYQLDKDGVIEGNRIYHPEGCQFITHAENTRLMLDNKRK